MSLPAANAYNFSRRTAEEDVHKDQRAAGERHQGAGVHQAETKVGAGAGEDAAEEGPQAAAAQAEQRGGQEAEGPATQTLADQGADQRRRPRQGKQMALGDNRNGGAVNKTEAGNHPQPSYFQTSNRALTPLRNIYVIFAVVGPERKIDKLTPTDLFSFFFFF